MKKILNIIFIFIISIYSLSAKGKTEESDYKQIGGKENWEYEIPLEGKAPGEYNVLIRAKDKANNETYAGPFDVILDPDSDLPIVSITNPLTFMRVGGDLNIVGTARDDDGIDKVYIKINDEAYEEANGKDFWSYPLSSTRFDDGQNIITVKAVDINGLFGNEQSVVYNQDTLKPKNTIVNYENGAIFSGKVTVNAEVEDANGISKILYSSDNEETYNSIKFEKNETGNIFTFSISIDTEKLEDGPNIYWFKSFDKTGSVAKTAFLFFVDNVGPEITLIDPPQEEKLNGEISISGKITDIIGIESFKYIYGDYEEEIKLYPGNPYWTIKVDTDSKLKEIKLTSVDTSGNKSEINTPLIVDLESDKPKITLNNPTSDKIYKESLTLEGTIVDDDYVKGLFYSIDNGDEVFLKTFNTFYENIDGLQSGKHKITITPVDNNDIQGDTVTIPFEIDSFNPILSINTVLKNSTENIFYSGYPVTTDGGYKILGSISAGNAIDKLEVRIGNTEFIPLEFVSLEQNTSTFSINVNSDFPYGITEISLLVTDVYGNKSQIIDEIYVKNYTKNSDDWGLYHIPVKSSDYIYLEKNIGFEMIFVGPDIISIKPSTKTEVFEVQRENKNIKIIPKKLGKIENVKFIIETAKGFFETREFNFIYDDVPPEIELKSPIINSNLSSSLLFQGRIIEDFLQKVEYRFSNSEEYKNIEFNSSNSFTQTIEIPETTAESLTITVRATDKTGNQKSVYRTFTIDENKFIQTLTQEEITGNTGVFTDNPLLFLNYPKNNQTFFTDPVISGFARDDDSVKSIKISTTPEIKDAEVINKDKIVTKVYEIEGLFDISLKEFGDGFKSLDIVAIDENGVESQIKTITYRFEPNKSYIKVNSYTDSQGENLYKNGVYIDNDTNSKLSGEITGGIKGNLEFSYNTDEFKPVLMYNNSFTIPTKGKTVWGQNLLRLKFTDKYGRVYLYNTFFYIVDKKYSRELRDSDGIYFNKMYSENEYVDITGNKVFTGFFIGRNIESIKLETKKGQLPNFFDLYRKNSRLIIHSLGNGISEEVRVVVKSIDGDIYYSDYYKFISDNNKPDLVVDTADKQFIQNEIELKGSVKDDIKIKSLEYSINNGITWNNIELKSAPVLEKKEKYTANSILDRDTIKKVEVEEYIFSHKLDLTMLKDNGYTVLVKVTDFYGNYTLDKRSFIKDSTNPKLELFIPGEDEVNGIVTLIGKSSDNMELNNVSYSFDGTNFINVGREGVFNFDVNFGNYNDFPESFTIKSTDMSGNFTEIFPLFNINQLRDKPVVQIQTPQEKETIRNDFVISGMAFDDDGIDTIYYSLDGGELKPVAKGENNFSVNIELDSIENNEHIITVKAVDILGIESDIVTSSFWVSKEEPTSRLILPKIDETKRNSIKLVGSSFDKNGIKSVYVSTDNGISYQLADGKEDWNYTFNTKNIKDGTYSLFVKAYDKLDTEGFYSTLINIDNTPPELIINQPVDGDILSDKILFSGRSMDNISLKEVKYKIFSHNSSSENNILVAEGELTKNGIFNIDIPLEGYELGDYNIELIAFDDANNRSISTRNFTVTEGDSAGDLELLFPQSGSTHTSYFEIAGKVTGHKKVDFVDCYIDDNIYSEIKVNEFNYFNLIVDSFMLKDGLHKVKVVGKLDDGQVYDTPEYEFSVKNSGAWVNITSMKTGDNISGRPFLTGEAGSYGQDVKPVLVEVSLDNGQIFLPADGTSQWKFRVETWQYEDGLTPVLVRAIFSNDEIRTARIAVNIDKTPPVVSILEDIEKGAFNDSIKISGISSDANGLTDISVILRDGSKSNYEIPGIFQGMFIDAESGFGKLYGVGIGLTFFDDNVKLQFTIGETRTASVDARIKGLFWGGKLLANLYSLDYGYLFGPDFSIFSSTLSLGASFTNKTLSIGSEDSIMWYSAIVGQLELLKVKFNNDYLSSQSIYIDFEATLISSENTGGFFPKLGIGTRVTLF